MDREDIIRLAREAGLDPEADWQGVFIVTTGFVERFYQLAVAAEREACAKVCENRYMGDNNREDMEAWRCAAAIRARGQA